jgi:lipopolysaccharide transport system ATP-binding protein
MSSNNAIEVNNVSKCYQLYDHPRDRLKQSIIPKLHGLIGLSSKNYYREFWALREVSFEIQAGETIGIIGRNGSGKSTLLQIICGTLAASHGKVHSEGRIAALLELGSGFNPEFTGRENIYMNAAILGFTKTMIDKRFENIVKFADIGDFIEQPVKIYSSGMLMRLAFAVSVYIDADIIVVDEALAVGDAAFQCKCLNRLRDLTAGGTTLLFVSHDMGMIKNYCNRTLYLKNGQICADGAAEVIAERYFMDMRDEQRRYTKESGSVKIKPFCGTGNGIAFGTDEGNIVSAFFTASEGSFSSYFTGEEINLQVEAKYHASIICPHLSVLLQDTRAITIGGKYFALQKQGARDGWIVDTLFVKFYAILSAGRYHLTLRLEDRASHTIFRPIDKQVGILEFEVIEKGKSFIGPVDLSIHAKC